MFKKKSIFILLIMCFNITFAQQMSKKEIKINEEKADYYFSEGNFTRSAQYYEKLYKAFPENVYYQLMYAVSSMYGEGDRSESLKLIEDVYAKNKENPDVVFYLARAYQLNKNFDEAIKTFKKYMRMDIAQEDKETAQRYLSQCENAKKLASDVNEKISIDPVGPPINTRYHEYVPLITPDESVLIFTYRGPKSLGGLQNKYGKPDPDGDYFEDIMISYKKDGQWSEPVSIGNNINTTKHDASIALSVDGQKLLIFKSTKKDNGDIYISYLQGTEWSRPVKVQGEINTNYWEGSATLSSDERFMIFASDRPGGFGGRDLYIAERLPDGTYGNVKNLGPTINTKYNEDSPYWHPDGVTLYFSSEGHNSMGGYDIFYSNLENNQWTKPVNVGAPVNTIDDDRFYVLSADGNTGYYSSARMQSLGGHDIFTVTPGHFGKKPILALVLGVVTANDEPAAADITVTNENTGELVGKYKSNEATGKYMLALTPGNKYKIAIELDGYEPQIEYLNVENLETYVQLEHDIALKSKDFAAKVQDVEKPMSLQEKLNQQIAKFKSIAQTDNRSNVTQTNYNLNDVVKGTDNSIINPQDTAKYVNDKMTELNTDKIFDKDKIEREKLKNVYDTPIDGVTFKVEIGSYTDVSQFDRQYWEKYGPIECKKYPEDGLTRCAFGPFNTLREAEEFRKMLIEKEKKSEDAFVTVFVFGQRKTLKEYADYPCNPNQPPVDFSDLVDKDLNDPKWYNLLLSKGGNICAEGLHFEVQIAAYRHPENYKYDHLIQFGQPVIRDYPDGITRFTQGRFTTLREAEALRQKIIKAGQTDAWITPFYNGKRMLMQDLIKVNFYGRSVN
ncbi:MAG: hypothetical protein KatS3mg034_1067 [Vicingaceae bacterium]|nr:MAG: hypothetical protein KatS3mg034_1067 [Vicingaceae bacterium]